MVGMNSFQEVVKARGLAVIAEACKVTPQAVHKWVRKGIPAKRVLKVESVTGISRYDLRKDIYGPKPKRRSAA